MVEFPIVENPLTPAVAVAVHEKVVPATFEVSTTSVVVCPEQTDWFSAVFDTFGEGFTVIVSIMPGPWHPFEMGVIV